MRSDQGVTLTSGIGTYQGRRLRRPGIPPECIIDIREISTGAEVTARPRADVKSGAMKLLTSFEVSDKVADELKKKSCVLNEGHDTHSRHFAKVWSTGAQPSGAASDSPEDGTVKEKVQRIEAKAGSSSSTSQPTTLPKISAPASSDIREGIMTAPWNQSSSSAARSVFPSSRQDRSGSQGPAAAATTKTGGGRSSRAEELEKTPWRRGSSPGRSDREKTEEYAECKVCGCAFDRATPCLCEQDNMLLSRLPGILREPQCPAATPSLFDELPPLTKTEFLDFANLPGGLKILRTPCSGRGYDGDYLKLWHELPGPYIDKEYKYLPKKNHPEAGSVLERAIESGRRAMISRLMEHEIHRKNHASAAPFMPLQNDPNDIIDYDEEYPKLERSGQGLIQI